MNTFNTSYSNPKQAVLPMLIQAEGIEVMSGKVDLEKYQWKQ